MKLGILPSAMEDLYSGRLFYARQGEGLGDYFFDAVFSDIDSLTLYAGIHPKVFGYHRLLAHRFPYAIYYAVEANVATVCRVLDLRQNPERPRRNLVSD